MNSRNYRPDIDGLRAVAVVPVILFHAGLDVLPGGFVGVDVFFVISGYLISKIIIGEINAGEFSFKRFYGRRLRRIIPALLPVLILSVGFFALFALPAQAVDAAKSAVAVLLSISNFYFWQQSGYFSPTAEYMPLLHTWSLAVEEQFYLGFPVLVAIAAKRVSRLGVPFLTFTILLFALGLWLSFTMPSVAYYLLPARAWELAAGAVVASGIVPRLRHKVLAELVAVGAIMLVLTGMLFIRSDMPFPGWVALLPCIGTALLLNSEGNAFVSRKFLASPPLVAVGLISYSLYLWHWPVLVAFRLRSASTHLSFGQALLAVGVTCALAWASWAFVERPFRSKQVIGSRALVISLALGTAATALLSAAVIGQAGFPSRLNSEARRAMSAAADIDPLRAPCERYTRGRACVFGNGDRAITLALVGDSHAAALRPAFEKSELLGRGQGTLMWHRACPLLIGARWNGDDDAKSCEKFKGDVLATLRDMSDLQVVVLSGRWTYPLTGWLPEVGGSNTDFLVDDESKEHSAAENERVFRRSMRRTLETLSAMGLQVVIVGSVPEPGFDVPVNVALRRNLHLTETREIPRMQVEKRMTLVDDVFADVVAGRPGVRFISLWRSLCPQNCILEMQGIPIYADDDHLSRRGAAEVLGPILARAP